MAFLMQRRRQRRGGDVNRIYRVRLNPLTEYTDLRFSQIYRLNKESIVDLAEELKRQGFKGPLHQLPNKRTISAVLTVCIGVRFLATGSMYRDIGLAHHVVPSTVCRCVRKTLDMLRAIMDRHIFFPVNRQKLLQNADEFYRLGGFPGAVAAVDGTHVGVRPPADDARAYKDRNFNYSLNVQVMCDPYLVFMDVDASRPGSCHDSFIWRNSVIGDALQTANCIHPFYILADSGYPLRPWLITPYMNVPDQRTRNFNFAQRSCRNVVERAIGLLKIRFRCLDKTGGVLQSPPDTATHIVSACMVLHNIAVRTRMGLDINEEDDDVGDGNEIIRRIVNGEEYFLPQHDEDERHELNDPDAGDRQMHREGQRVRDAILRDYF